MTGSLEGKLALVTGAANGIGAACACVLAEAGATVVCADLADTADTVAKIDENNGSAIGRECNVADENAVLSLFAEFGAELPPLDILVHCAGIIHEAPLLDTSTEEFDRVVAVNLRGSFLVGREAIRAMQGRGGRIILTASDMAYYGRETFSPYVASKHAVLGLTRSWAKEFAPDILVNALCPGPIDTAMLAAENMTPEWRKKEMAIPLARFGEPEEVARMALFLAGLDGSYITGQGLGVNGGSIMP